MKTPFSTKRAAPGLAVAACVALALTAGCTREGKFQPVSMWNESRLKPYEPVPEGGTQSSSLRPPAGTIARGQRYAGDPIVTGRQGAELLTTSPVPLTRAVLERGQERYNVYCTPCHGRLGDGMGMASQRGFPHPPDYALPRLREAPIGHFYDVITNGYGVMYSYAERIPVEDRWAISGYIRVLQKTRAVVPVDRFEAERERARQQGIVDPSRGMRLPNTPQGGQIGTPAPQQNAPETKH